MEKYQKLLGILDSIFNEYEQIMFSAFLASDENQFESVIREAEKLKVKWSLMLKGD
ncbi:MAG TPA: hypothetical protein VGB37_09490 [Candidatus Lokiarchaeia archaeon]